MIPNKSAPGGAVSNSTPSYMALAHVPAPAIASTNKAKTIASVVDRVQGPRIFANPVDKPSFAGYSGISSDFAITVSQNRHVENVGQPAVHHAGSLPAGLSASRGATVDKGARLAVGSLRPLRRSTFRGHSVGWRLRYGVYASAERFRRVLRCEHPFRAKTMQSVPLWISRGALQNARWQPLRPVLRR